MSTVRLSDFMRGMVTTLGGELVDVKEPGGVRRAYAIDCTDPDDGEVVWGPELFQRKVPVYMVVGHSAYTPKYFPAVVIRMGDLAPAFDAGGAAWHIDYRKRAKHAQERQITLPSGEVKTGYDAYEVKPRAIPYSITFDIEARARGDRAMLDGLALFGRLSQILRPPGFFMTLLDSVGDERRYTAAVESVTPELSAFEMTDRGTAWMWSVRVYGEIDAVEPYDERAVFRPPVLNIP